MIRSNTTEAREAIIDYIGMDRDYLEEYGIAPKDDTEMLAAVYQVFRAEKANGDSRRMSEYALFEEWAQGLALGQLFCYYYSRSAVDDLAGILEETPEEAARYTESEAEEMLTRLIYREVVRGFERWSC